MTQHILIPPGREIPEIAEAATPHRVLGSEAIATPKCTTTWKAWSSM